MWRRFSVRVWDWTERPTRQKEVKGCEHSNGVQLLNKTYPVPKVNNTKESRRRYEVSLTLIARWRSIRGHRCVRGHSRWMHVSPFCQQMGRHSSVCTWRWSDKRVSGLARSVPSRHCAVNKDSAPASGPPSKSMIHYVKESFPSRDERDIWGHWKEGFMGFIHSRSASL